MEEKCILNVETAQYLLAVLIALLSDHSLIHVDISTEETPVLLLSPSLNHVVIVLAIISCSYKSQSSVLKTVRLLFTFISLQIVQNTVDLLHSPACSVSVIKHYFDMTNNTID